MKAGTALLGLMAGVAIGAALGIIFAPDKGTETRKKILKTKDKLTEGWENKLDEFIDSVTEKSETVKSDATKMAKHGERKAEEFAKNYK